MQNGNLDEMDFQVTDYSIKNLNENIINALLKQAKINPEKTIQEYKFLLNKRKVDIIENAKKSIKDIKDYNEIEDILRYAVENKKYNLANEIKDYYLDIISLRTLLKQAKINPEKAAEGAKVLLNQGSQEAIGNAQNVCDNIDKIGIDVVRKSAILDFKKAFSGYKNSAKTDNDKNRFIFNLGCIIDDLNLSFAKIKMPRKSWNNIKNYEKWRSELSKQAIRDLENIFTQYQTGEMSQRGFISLASGIISNFITCISSNEKLKEMCNEDGKRMQPRSVMITKHIKGNGLGLNVNLKKPSREISEVGKRSSSDQEKSKAKRELIKVKAKGSGGVVDFGSKEVSQIRSL
ncbi:hypothetical protein [Candidatus Deianiraea vastatrix]|uniref:Uncharacterized protein n=1 Tax=Candidatus Deianiraea vastatrix TaxID=2163644 RepID=A0A5B8XE98_9RICK|nr:hypothetical protein [Candidatus Deianiraea vastatrix]QED23669.1 hypothetical protein Deia_00882 [Candidatus Deianiraea vastatrix]